MKTEYKIYAGLLLLLALGAGVYFSNSSAKAERATRSTSTAKADLPAIAVVKEEADKITKIEIKAEKGPVTLEKKGDEWELTQPISAKANQNDVKSLLENLKDLKVTEAIDRTKDHYAEYELDDAKAIHFVASNAGGKVANLYFGKSGTRGQLVRVDGKDGVFVTTGYQAFLYNKEAKNWRDKTLIKISDDEVKAAEEVTIDNANGEFVFTKKDGKWQPQFSKLEKDGKPGKPEEKWEKFDSDKVEDLLKTFKSLNAVDFADADQKPKDTGLDDPKAQGGVVKIKLKDKTIGVSIGKTQKGKNRYAQKEGDPTVVVVWSAPADWATADQSKFEKKDDKKKDDKGPEAPPPPDDDDMPPGMDGE